MQSEGKSNKDITRAQRRLVVVALHKCGAEAVLGGDLSDDQSDMLSARQADLI